MSDIAMPRPPRPFMVDANAIRLARVKAAAAEDRRAQAFRDRGFMVRAAEIRERAREMRECA